MEIRTLTGSDLKKYTVQVSPGPGGLLCQPWDYLGHAFEASDLEDAASKVAEESDAWQALHAAAPEREAQEAEEAEREAQDAAVPS